MRTRTGFSHLQIILHWLIAVLIIAAFFSHDMMHDAFEARLKGEIVPGSPLDGPLHTVLGLAVFWLTVLRIIVRVVQGAPRPVAGTPPRMELVARLGHLLLYVLMLAVPFAGGYAWYNGSEAVGEVHEILGKLIMIVAFGHALAAIYHQWVMKDGTLTRMMRPGG